MNTLLKKHLSLFFTALAFFTLPNLAITQYTDTTRVIIHDLGDYYEMENGFLGVTIPKASLFNINTPDYVPAPIRNIIYRDEAQSNGFPNYLNSPSPALSMAVSIITQNTDTCTIKVSYTFDKPELNDGVTVFEPAGPGYYDATIQMVVGEKACMVYEESDFEVEYSIKTSDGLEPDKGRFVGFRSTSVNDGYDINNQVYVKSDVEGWNAELDLSFSQRKDYEAIYNWGPWGVNTGWNWQMYNSSGSATSNTFGAFHGRPSKLLGAQVSGVNLWTEPASISDLHGWCDEDGNCEYIWTSENDIWHKSLDENGTWSTEEIVATGLVNPFVFAEGGTINILAIDPLVTNNPIRLLKKVGAGSWTNHTISIDATIDDPYIYGASNSTHDFIFVEGNRSGTDGIFMYSAATGTTTFTFADDLPSAIAFRSSNRPDVRKLTNGDILFTFTQDFIYQSLNLVEAGTTTFTSSTLYPFGSRGTFGTAIDPRTGDFFFVEQGNFNINYIDLNGITIDNEYSDALDGLAHDHQGFDVPNRRSMATDGSGNALVHHNGYLQSSYYVYFDSGTNSWTDITNSAWEEIEYAHIHFNPSDGLFYIVGKYQGKLSRFSFNGSGNPVFIETFNSTEKHSAGVKIYHNRLAANKNYYPDIKFEWGIYAGRKGLDLYPLDTVQAISKTQNRLSGLAQRVEAYQNTPATFSSNFLNGSIYITPTEVQAIIDKVKNDNDFYTRMWQLDASFKPVMDAWRDPTMTETNLVYDDIVGWADSLINDLKTGDGIYSFYHFYSQGANEMRRRTTHISGLLADGRLSTTQIDTLKKKAALFARVVWDDDFSPIQEGSGVGLGTANMLTSYKSYRWFFAMLLKDDPEFAARAAAVPSELKEVFSEAVNGVGAPINNSHYLQTALDGLIFTALQLKNQNIVNEFAQNDTLKLFSDFLFFLKTPESVRFGGNRKLINFGDGTEESAAIFGLLGTGYAGSDDELSKNLMYSYRNGPERGSDFGPVVIAINHELPDTNTLQMSSGHFPDYMSTFRSALGTEKETASWLLNGDWLSDHRNDDRGAVMMYALGAPMVLQYGNFYNPYIQGGHMQNIIIPQTQFPEWNNTSSQPFLLPQTLSWYTSEHEDYFDFGNSSSSSVLMDNLGTHWHRKFYQFNANDDVPIFVVKDSLNDNSNDYIWNMSFTSDGTVSTPGGDVDPPARLWDYQSGPNEQPAASAEIALSSGSLHKFDFTGINWVDHPAGGIDFEVYSEANVAQSATLSEWAHTFIPIPEAQEFLATNSSSFEERQQMLRIRGKEHFYTIMVPYYKGLRPNNLSVNKSGNVLTVSCDDFTFETNLYYSTYTSSGKKVLTTFNSQSLTFANSTISGGPMELEVYTDTIIARLHGATGDREVTLPAGNWVLNSLSSNAVYNSGTGKWTLSLPTLDTLHNSFRGGYEEFMFIQAIQVSPKVFLEGPYDNGNGNLKDDLRVATAVPTEEPYTDLAAFTHVLTGGNEVTTSAVLQVTGNDAIVDWLFVELRDKTTPANVVATRAALLQKDGDVVDLDGVSPLKFTTNVDDYYLAIRHRNHLGVMSNATLSLSSTTTAIDFTDSATATWGTNAQVDLGGGVMALWAADIDNSGSIDASDRSEAWNKRNETGYLQSDASMNGSTDAADRSQTWNNRNVTEQLPQ